MAETFRPPRPLRVTLCVFAALSAWAVLAQAGRLAHGPTLSRGVGLLVFSVPCWLAAAAQRRRVIVLDEGVRSLSLFGARTVAWEEIRWVDQTRASFVVVTRHGPISAGWLSRSERDRLMRLILQRGRLAASPQKPRWGVRVRYVPRAQPIRLQPVRKPTPPTGPEI